MNHIEIESAFIKNFRNISELEVEFKPKSLVLIIGKNGAGKSTIYNAIYTCLYNTQVNGRPASKGIKEGEKSSFLNLKFNINTEKYILERTIGKGAKVILRKLDEKDPIATGQKVKKIIEELIPVNILKLAMLKQLNIKELISGFIDVSSFVKEISDEIKTKEQKYNDLDFEISKIENKLESFDNQIFNLTNTKENLKNQIKNIESDIHIIYNSLNVDIENKENISATEYIELKNKITEFYSEYNIFCENIEQDIRNKISLEVDSPLNKLNSQKSLVNTKLNELLTRLDIDFNQKTQPARTQIQNIEFQIEEKTKEINKIENLIKTQTCFTCDREIDKDDIDKYYQRIEVLNRECIGYQNQIRNIEKEIQDFQDIINHHKLDYNTRAQNKLKEIDNEINTLNNLKNSYEQELLSLEDIKKQKFFELLQKYEIDESQLNINYDIIIDNINKINQKYAMIKTNQNNITEIDKQIEDIKKQKQTFQKENKIEDIKKKQIVLKDTIDVLKTWNNTRLLKKLLVKKIGSTLHNILQTKYNIIFDVKLNITDNDELEILMKNNNGVYVDFKDASCGESIITTLELYSAIRDLFSMNYRISNLFLDEFLDNLDYLIVPQTIKFLKDQCEKQNQNISLISHRIDIQNEAVDEIIDMNLVNA